ncbi:NAD+ synthetase, partial [mine drainage metagenome]
GFPGNYTDHTIANAAALLGAGRVVGVHRKAELPNYKVFDEKRYFHPGSRPTVVTVKGFRVGVLICEDIWVPEPVRSARAAGAELLVVINASPYECGKQREREAIARARVTDVGLPMAYVNTVSGQDELVFDGNSFAMDATGEVCMRAPPFVEGLYRVDFVRERGRVVPRSGPVAAELSDEASVYGALVLGVRDYVTKHGFPGVVMGLSGGIDSALTLAIAVDALGPERVHAVMMPSRYTSQMSLDDAADEARQLGVKYSVLSIEDVHRDPRDAGRGVRGAPGGYHGREHPVALPDAAADGLVQQDRTDAADHRQQERDGGRLATLYGDMAGGFAPIKDCSKLLVYRLAAYRNGLGAVIPQRVIDRAPSAELRADQKDSDALPPYEVLDPILAAFIEEDLSVEEIAARGFDRATVGRVLDLVKRNEYKRRQAPPGVRVSRRAFGRDWRYPITNGYRRESR